MLLARGHISTFKILYTRWFSVVDIFRISFHIDYVSNMNTFDFHQFSDGGISHWASLTSWSFPGSYVKKMAMMMMMIIIIIIIIITNHWFFLPTWGKKKGFWNLQNVRVCVDWGYWYWYWCWSLHIKFLTILPISLKFWINLIIVADDLYRPFLFPKTLITTWWTCRLRRPQGH